jgi:hypothetical protein
VVVNADQKPTTSHLDRRSNLTHPGTLRCSGVAGEGLELCSYKFKTSHGNNRSARSTSVPSAILDFGAGVCGSVRHLKVESAQSSLTCIKSSRSLEMTASRFPGQADFGVFDGRRLPLEPLSSSASDRQFMVVGKLPDDEPP